MIWCPQNNSVDIDSKKIVRTRSVFPNRKKGGEYMAGVQTVNLTKIAVSDTKVTAQASNSGQQFQNILNSTGSVENNGNAAKNSVSTNQKVSDKTHVSDKSYQKIKNTDQTTNTVRTDDNTTVDTTNKSLAQVQDDIKEIVQDATGMDDNMLQSMLDSMGIMLTDLLNPSTLQDFVLQVNGASESMDLVMNESLMNSYTALLQDLADYMSGNGDQIAAALEQLSQPTSVENFGISMDEVLDPAQTEQTVTEDIPVQTQDAESVVVNTAKNAQITTQDSNANDDAIADDGKTEVKSVSIVSEQQNTSFDDSDTTEDNSTQEELQKLFTSDAQQETTFVQQDDTAVSQPYAVVQGNVSQIYDANAVNSHQMQQMVHIVHQVSEQMQQSVTQNTTALEMQLNPESLGKVLLNLVSKEGMMTATFHVQTEEARQALESQMYTLKENLEAKEIKVESVEVHVSDFSFEQSTEAEAQRQNDMQNGSQRKFRYNVADEEEDDGIIDEKEALRKEVMRNNGSSIDYTA